MSVVVIGGDHLGGIRDKLADYGMTELVHVSGRKNMDGKRVTLSDRTGLVLILTDYVNHGLMNRVKDEAKLLNIPVVFARRSWSALCKELDRRF